jgi:hypothetical protein
MDQLRNIHPGVHPGALDASIAKAETERAHRGKRSGRRRPDGQKVGWVRRLFRRPASS